LYKVFIFSMVLTSTLFGDYYITQGKKQTLTKLDAQKTLSKTRGTSEDVTYYTTKAGKQLGVNKNIIVSFDDLSIQLDIEKKFSLSLDKTLGAHRFVYAVSNNDKTLEIANALSQIKGITAAYPDFIIKKNKRYTPNDPSFYASWHLNASSGINVQKAWDYTKGTNITVGIYDEGIDIEHEDLRDNILGYGNYNNPNGQIDLVADGATLDNNTDNAPAPESDRWHGTSCAGLIAAVADNRKGSAGVAPESKLIALRYSDKVSRDIEAFNDMAKEGVAIISNSWGTYSMDPQFNETLKELSENGRDGKGLLVFFAAGNDGCNMDQYYSIQSDSSGNTYRCESTSNSQTSPINDESESPYVISIAASTRNDRIASYSNYGSSIDFTAPGSQSSIFTTDAMYSKGAPGAWNYTDSFSGTSAAAPIAAGIAALILSENPELSKEEVLDIMKTTAQKNGAYNYDSDGRNDHWGYGMVDAGEAVKLASTYGTVEIENFAHKMYKDMH